MQCKCGGEALSSHHEVKTLKGAAEWWAGSKQHDLPAVVQSCQCDSCGRFGFKMYDHRGDLMVRKGV